MNSFKDFSRVDRPIRAAENYYSNLSGIYDILASSEKRYVRRGLDLLDPQTGEWILEIGYGTGYAQQRIAPLVREGFSTGLDLSVGMGRVAQRKIYRAGLQDRVGLVQSDTLPIPYPADIFDGIFSSFTLELFDSPLIPKVLGECRRVLKPGGRLVIVSLSRDNPLGLMGKIYESFHNHFPNWADCRPIPVKILVKDAGFSILKFQEHKMWGLAVGIVLVT
jgi:ubiquinone/menaquinone biosynthesis C-methylase UbiE